MVGFCFGGHAALLAATLPDEQGVLLVQEMKTMARAYLDYLVAQDK